VEGKEGKGEGEGEKRRGSSGGSYAGVFFVRSAERRKKLDRRLKPTRAPAANRVEKYAADLPDNYLPPCERFRVRIKRPDHRASRGVDFM